MACAQIDSGFPGESRIAIPLHPRKIKDSVGCLVVVVGDNLRKPHINLSAVASLYHQPCIVQLYSHHRKITHDMRNLRIFCHTKKGTSESQEAPTLNPKP